jgi:DNA-binding HxlR family transcriptional regulator
LHRKTHYCKVSCFTQPDVTRITLVLKRDYEGQNCSIAKTLELIGERWTLLIIRDVFTGTRRFEDFQARNGIARNVLSARLTRLVDEGILEKRRYQDRPVRFEYRLTEKGIALWPVLVTLVKWGDTYTAEDGPPVVIEHKNCGGQITDHLTCDRCGAQMTARDAKARPGPGATATAA